MSRRNEPVSADPFHGLEGSRSPLSGAAAFEPAFDVREAGDAYVFEADLPGVRGSDVEITLRGQRLTISATRNTTAGARRALYCAERSFGTFSRTFTLPADIDAERVSAVLRDGVLELRVAKARDVQSRRIPVQSEFGSRENENESEDAPDADASAERDDEPRELMEPM